ncbi:MAG: HEPN domain-containing protein [Armatimonadetes bacterium]|nr:HEPN domain-containing protein [Armatimonadota bacterium]
MNAITPEWVAKAEADMRTAMREMAAEDDANYDAVCFHAQQSAEKYLKARLSDAGIPFPKTHDLGLLVSLAVAVEPSWQSALGHVDCLTDLAVEVRYPGVAADREDAASALAVAKTVRAAVRRSLALDE